MAAAIVGAGILTPVGLSLEETAASARARLSLAQEIAWVDRRFDPYIVGVVPDEALPPLHPDLAAQGLAQREARMLQLAHAAVEQALAAQADALQKAPLPVLLGLPELHSARPIDGARFLERLQRQCAVAFDLPASGAAARGRAAGLLALRRAVLAIESGQCAQVLVGGVDSLVDLFVLDRLDAQARIRGEVVSDGFTPAEGACFLLLESEERARGRGQKVLAVVHGTASAMEAGHMESQQPYLGDGLAEAFTHLFAASPPRAPVACMYASLNGERYWSRELGTARIRSAPHFAPDVQMEHPAESFGDLGAAHGIALAALAAHAIQGAYRVAPCVVYASSDLGDRAAVLLDASGPH